MRKRVQIDYNDSNPSRLVLQCRRSFLFVRHPKLSEGIMACGVGDVVPVGHLDDATYGDADARRPGAERLAGGGASGALTQTRSATTQARIGELQVLAAERHDPGDWLAVARDDHRLALLDPLEQVRIVGVRLKEAEHLVKPVDLLGRSKPAASESRVSGARAFEYSKVV